MSMCVGVWVCAQQFAIAFFFCMMIELKNLLNVFFFLDGRGDISSVSFYTIIQLSNDFSRYWQAYIYDRYMNGWE